MVNLLGITDAEVLDTVLNEVVSLRWFQLRGQPVPENPDFSFLTYIHELFFGEIFPFAGKLRTTDVEARGTGIIYCRPDFIDANLISLFSKLADDDYLRGLTLRQFADTLAARWGDLTQIHPFRDGNTRAQSAYVSVLAERAGFQLDWSSVDVGELRELRLLAVAGKDKPLADYLYPRLIPWQ